MAQPFIIQMLNECTNSYRHTLTLCLCLSIVKHSKIKHNCTVVHDQQDIAKDEDMSLPPLPQVSLYSTQTYTTLDTLALLNH